MWGMAHNLNDVLVAQFKLAFSLTNLQAGFVQSAFYVAYAVMPIPVSFAMHRLGYKNSVVAGLLLYGIGAILFWPAAQMLRYELFLVALFVIACGIVFLETSGMAIMGVLGPEEQREQRISLASAFNPLGSIAGVFIGQHFILAQQKAGSGPATVADLTHNAQAVQLPYLMIGALVLSWAALIMATPFPAATLRRNIAFQPFVGFAALFSSRAFNLGIVAQFLSVGAQIACWSYLMLYAREANLVSADKDAANYLMISLGLFMAGRFLSTFALKWISSARLCLIAGSANVLLLCVVVFAGGQVGLWALVAVGFFMSVNFPAIYSIGLSERLEHARLGSALMIMSILGGAVVTAVMGRAADLTSVRSAYATLILCFLAVAIFGWMMGRKPSGR